MKILKWMLNIIELSEELKMNFDNDRRLCLSSFGRCVGNFRLKVNLGFTTIKEKLKKHSFFTKSESKDTAFLSPNKLLSKSQLRQEKRKSPILFRVILPYSHPSRVSYQKEYGSSLFDDKNKTTLL